MQEYVLKMPRRLRGIVQENGSRSIQIFGKPRPRTPQAAQIDKLETEQRLLKERVHYLESELQRAREESFQAGLEEGRELGMQEAGRDMEDLRALVAAIQDQYQHGVENLREPFLQLVHRVAEAVLGFSIRRFEGAEEMLKSRLQRFFYALVEQSRVMIEVNPQHLSWLENGAETRELGAPGAMEVKFVANPRLGPGECLVKSENFLGDGTIAGQLEHLLEQFQTEEIEWKR